MRKADRATCGAGALALAWLTALGAPASADVETLVMHQKLLGSDAAPDRLFGYSVGLSGDVAVIGTFFQQDAGTAHVFRRDGASWTEEQILTASDGAPFDLFGRAVAVSGDLVIVGAPRDQDSGFASGSAYAFRHDGAAWVEEQKLLPLDGSANAYFGLSVAVEGDVALIGAPLDDVERTDGGAAYVFRHDGSAWTQERKLVASDITNWDRTGWAVALSGGRAFLGAPKRAPYAVYAFELQGSSWVETQILEASPSPAGNAWFGSALATRDELLVVGAYNAIENSVGSGAAYVYRHDGSAWMAEQTLTASDAIAGHDFGYSVGVLDDGRVLAGARIDLDGTGNARGAVYSFRHDPVAGAWVEIQKVVPPDPGGPGANFGFSLAADGLRALIGAPGDSEGGDVAGAAYVYGPAQPLTFCTGKTSSLGCVPFVSTSGTPSATATAPFGIRAGDVLPGEIGFLLYGSKASNLSFHGGKLCIKAPVTRLLPPQSAKATGTPPCSGVIKRDFNQRIQSGVDPQLTAGRRVVAQWRLRDPGDPAGFGDSLTDAVRFEICP